MTVSELIAILSKCDPDLPVVTHADNHTCHSYDTLRVGLLRRRLASAPPEKNIVVGNISRRNINGESVRVIQLLDGGTPLPNDWPTYTQGGGSWHFPKPAPDDQP